MSYHKTVDVTQQEAQLYAAIAEDEQGIVYELFCMKKIPMSWSEVCSFLPGILEGNIKRCLSDLSNPNRFTDLTPRLIKTSEKVKSKYGRSCYRYKLFEK